MATKGTWTDEKTVRYLLSVIKSCADFQPDFNQVAREFEITTSRPGIDALVASSFIPKLSFLDPPPFSSTHFPPSKGHLSFPLPKSLQNASSYRIGSGPASVRLLHHGKF
jgi:hypothetical protein